MHDNVCLLFEVTPRCDYNVRFCIQTDEVRGRNIVVWKPPQAPISVPQVHGESAMSKYIRLIMFAILIIGPGGGTVTAQTLGTNPKPHLLQASTALSAITDFLSIYIGIVVR